MTEVLIIIASVIIWAWVFQIAIWFSGLIVGLTQALFWGLIYFVIRVWKKLIGDN